MNVMFLNIIFVALNVMFIVRKNRIFVALNVMFLI